MALVMPLCHKLIKNILVNTGYCGSIEIHPLPVNRQKRDRQHHIAYTDGGSNGFGKGTVINYPVSSVHSLQSRNRLSFISEFTVIIILNKIPPFLFISPYKKLLPSLYRHNNTGRILMGRHDIGDIRPAFFQKLYIHAGPVHGNRNHLIF